MEFEICLVIVSCILLIRNYFIMPIYLYNTLTRQKEIFKPIEKGKVGLYACGPTVYWYAHVGNFRSFIFEDTLRRVLEYNGYKVKHVMNFTDVGHLTSEADEGEDKMEKGARREGKTAQEIADFYIAAFKRDAAILNIQKPTIYARATDCIKEQIDLVKILEKKRLTYKIYDGIYFDTSKLKNYGQLAQLDRAGIKAGARVEMVHGKKHPTDFALWKLTPAGVKRQQEWSSPWGRGWPGWHLECSAISQKYLGKQFDIHCGGIDHIPIHHTNEIAQSEGVYGKNPARLWLHNEFLLVDGNKMSKSLGNLITIDKVAKMFSPLAYRYLTLTAHYRSQLNLTWESLEAANIVLQKIYQAVWDFTLAPKSRLWLIKILQFFGPGDKMNKVVSRVAQYQQDFLTAVNDDLDTPKSLSLLWGLIDDKDIPASIKKNLLFKFDRVWGLKLNKAKIIPVPTSVKKIAQEREKYRQQKNWLKADVLRAQIENEGWLVEDTPDGAKLKPKKISADR